MQTTLKLVCFFQPFIFNFTTILTNPTWHFGWLVIKYEVNLTIHHRE